MVTCHNDEKFFENSRRVPKWRIFTELPEMPKWRKIWGFHNDEKIIRHYGRSLNKYSRISRTKLFSDCSSCDFRVENLFSNQKKFLISRQETIIHNERPRYLEYGPYNNMGVIWFNKLVTSPSLTQFVSNPNPNQDPTLTLFLKWR